MCIRDSFNVASISCLGRGFLIRVGAATGRVAGRVSASVAFALEMVARLASSCSNSGGGLIVLVVVPKGCNAMNDGDCCDSNDLVVERVAELLNNFTPRRSRDFFIFT